MSETPMPETLETIAAKIDALATSVEQRFAGVDRRFGAIDQRFAAIDQRFAAIDGQFDETRAQLGVKIEAVDAKVDKVYDELIAMCAEANRNTSERETYTSLLENHDIRLLALEKREPPRP
jgi:hypothetical protein